MTLNVTAEVITEAKIAGIDPVVTTCRAAAWSFSVISKWLLIMIWFCVALAPSAVRVISNLALSRRR
jgi:hypothetical protein